MYLAIIVLLVKGDAKTRHVTICVNEAIKVLMFQVKNIQYKRVPASSEAQLICTYGYQKFTILLI